MIQTSEFFAASPEFQRTYGGLDDGEFVSLVYQNVLGRNPDAAGFAFWLRQLQSGQSRGWMMLAFTEAPSQEFQQGTKIAVVVTEIYAAMMKRSPTLAEYDAFTRLAPPGGLLGVVDYPLQPGQVNPVYLEVLAKASYRARINIR